jgi:hypothetical protein
MRGKDIFPKESSSVVPYGEAATLKIPSKPDTYLLIILKFLLDLINSLSILLMLLKPERCKMIQIIVFKSECSTRNTVTRGYTTYYTFKQYPSH